MNSDVQHGCKYTPLLPYGDEIKDESKIHLKKIIEGLASAIQLDEIVPGAVYWLRQFREYSLDFEFILFCTVVF
eukprot:Pgem_evm1s2349